MSLMRPITDFLGRQYQPAAKEFVLETKRCALFVEPGLGKTVIVASALAEAIDNFEIKRVLVVAPPRVARETWPEEFQEWLHLNDYSFVSITGSPTARKKLVHRSACFHFISVDMLHWLIAELGTSMPYDAVVMDESTKIKTPDTRRWCSMDEIAFKRKKNGDIVFRQKYFVLMTGTPASEGLLQLWGQMWFVDRGERLGRNITAFRDKWFSQPHGQAKYRPKAFAAEQIEQAISDVVFTLRESDYANLPPRMYNNIWLTLEPEQMAKYTEFEKKFVLNIDDTTKITAFTSAAVRSKCLQLANGVVYQNDPNDHNEPPAKIEHVIHDAKIEALQDLVDELSGQTLLVAYRFKSDAARILKKFKQAVLFTNKAGIKERWNRGEIPILVAHPSSMAHGLNLQHGGHTICWYGITDSNEDYIQLNKRLHRSGQGHPVMIHHILARGTVDEDVMEALEGKTDVQEKLLNALKKRHKMYKD